MEFLITKASAKSERIQDFGDITSFDSVGGWKETMPGPRSICAHISIDMVSNGEFSKLWEMTTDEANEYITRAILEKIQKIEI